MRAEGDRENGQWQGGRRPVASWAILFPAVSFFDFFLRSALLRKLLSFFRKPTQRTEAQPVSHTRAAALPSWQSTRGPKLEADRALRPDAQKWLALLPEHARPKLLCSAYPRLANRFAMIWANRPASKSYFDDLLIDRRGGRIGFSQEVRDELMRLRDHYETAMSDAHAIREWRQRMSKASETSSAAPPKAKE